jgi:hypothetical protein
MPNELDYQKNRIGCLLRRRISPFWRWFERSGNSVALRAAYHLTWFSTSKHSGARLANSVTTARCGSGNRAALRAAYHLSCRCS